ncbi:MAG: hypothetical protein DLM50_04610 [Candidatus Meridianibacter frigidus]|nr:MAG: hypothetical protein DLM50_04610 [Candidatus Eremiobacteraeota bacterium]
MRNAACAAARVVARRGRAPSPRARTGPAPANRAFSARKLFRGLYPNASAGSVTARQRIQLHRENRVEHAAAISPRFFGSP